MAKIMKNSKDNTLPGFESLKQYAYILLIILLGLHLLAFLAFRIVVEQQLRYDLESFSRTVKSSANSDTNPTYTNGFVVLPNTNTVSKGKHKEIKINNNEYLAYAPTDQNHIYAVPESQIKQDLMLTAVILTLLYFGEVVVLVGWWNLLKDKVRMLFSVK